MNTSDNVVCPRPKKKRTPCDNCAEIGHARMYGEIGIGGYYDKEKFQAKFQARFKEVEEMIDNLKKEFNDEQEGCPSCNLFPPQFT